MGLLLALSISCGYSRLAIVNQKSTQSAVNLIFYLVAATSIWYLYDLKVLGLLSLSFLNVAALTVALSEIYLAFKYGLGDLGMRFVGSFLLAIITCFLVYEFLQLKALLSFGVIAMLITVFISFRKQS